LLFRLNVGRKIRWMRVTIQHMTVGATDSELPAKSIHKRNEMFAANIGGQHLEIREFVRYMNGLWPRLRVTAGLRRYGWSIAREERNQNELRDYYD
jgi:hypothetical protein